MVLIPNKHLHATINSEYPEGTSLWTILDGILARYHLIPDIKMDVDANCITVQLLEGPSWAK